MFKWTFHLFIFLLFFQFGFILFLYSVFNKRKAELAALQPEVSFSCGDFDTQDNFEPLANAGEDPRTCLHQECPDSMWIHKSQEQQAEELHVVSARAPLPELVEGGGHGDGFTIMGDAAKSAKRYTLVLIGQKDLAIWKVTKTEDSNLKKVILVGPGMAWVEGLPEGFPIDSFSPETLCAYPLGWEEIANPSNQFRRLKKALQTYTGLGITSFQGKKMARIFSLPPVPAKRKLESPALVAGGRDPAAAAAPVAEKSVEQPMGLKWQRYHKRLQARLFTYRDGTGKVKKVAVPDKTQQALFAETHEKIFLIKKYEFGWWDPVARKFGKISVPMSLPDIHWPTSMAYDSKRQQVLVYNDERGGEIYIYNLLRKTWRRSGMNAGYTLSGLTYSKSEDAFFATRLSGTKITQIIKLNSDGQLMASRDLDQPMAFSRSLWHLRLASEASSLWLWVHHPAKPEGERWPLEKLKASL